MDTFRIIKRLSSASGVTMLRLAARVGLTPQGFYKSLHSGNISFKAMNEALGECGYALLIGKVEDGRVVNARPVEYYEGD